MDPLLFIVNLGMWPLKSIISENRALFWGFNTHLWGFQGDRWENIYFESKHMHVTCEINSLGKMRPVLRISRHIYVVSKKIDGKMFILRVNLGMWPSNRSSWKNKPCSEVSTQIFGVSKVIDGKMFMFRGNLGLWPLILIVLEKWGLLWGFQHTFLGFSSR